MRYEWQALAQFIKDWNGLSRYREAMLLQPTSGSSGDPQLAYIAATVHALCLRDGWPVPDWVHHFIADELFTGKFSKEQWENNAPDMAAFKKGLHPVGEKHNVALEHLRCI